MKLEQLDTSTLRKAIDTYLAIAYEDAVIPDAVRERIELPINASGLRCFSDRFEVEDADTSARYFLRLGNRSYPHMKLGLVAYTGSNGQYVFVADTHDRHFEVDPNTPGYEQFLELKKENEIIKHLIERAWEDTGIETERAICLPPDSQSNLTRNKTVLLVDDTTSTLLMEEVAFSRAGFTTIACESGFEALEAVRTKVIDVCVLDVMMPVMSGYEFIDALKAEGLKSFPIILCTAVHESELHHLDNVEDLVRKPFNVGFLIERASQLLAKA